MGFELFVDTSKLAPHMSLMKESQLSCRGFQHCQGFYCF